MKRSELMKKVVAAAYMAGLPANDRWALMRHVADLDLKRVARGTYRRHDCVCPAVGAGLIAEADLADPGPEFERKHAAVEEFTRRFDAATAPEDGDRFCKVIEVED